MKPTKENCSKFGNKLNKSNNKKCSKYGEYNKWQKKYNVWSSKCGRH